MILTPKNTILKTHKPIKHAALKKSQLLSAWFWRKRCQYICKVDRWKKKSSSSGELKTHKKGNKVGKGKDAAQVQ